MLLSAVVSTVLGTAPGAPTFAEYSLAHSKTYADAAERAMREQLYAAKLRSLEAHNASPWGAHYTQGVNKFSDWTDAERAALFGLNKGMLQARRGAQAAADAADAGSYEAANEEAARAAESEALGKFPAAWDWAKKGALTRPRDQGTCGSCWAFAGTEAIESALFLSTGKLAKLSPQAFNDCTPNPKQCGGTGGCEGATFDLLYEYASNLTAGGGGMGGAVLDAAYPYTGKDGACRDKSVATHATVAGWTDVASNNVTALMAAVLKQPVAVGVAAMNWGDYMGGVYPHELCDGDIDHAVLLVGWGVDPGLGAYWKIKNSWGVGWGEDGYIRLQRRKAGYCTIDSQPGDGLGCKGGPAKVQVCGACAILYAPSYPTGVKLAGNGTAAE